MAQDFYRTKIEQKRLHKAFSKLNSLYATIPATTGCLENNCKEGGCKSWCCVLQSPQILYVEFLHTLQYILKNWTIEDISEVVDKSVYHYISNYPTKGCIFFDRKTNLCQCHTARPLNCYIYGITPYEEFHPRYLKMIERYKGVFSAAIKDQCNLVKTLNGKEVTILDIDKWWNKLVDIEHSIGISRDLINDNPGGTYRTPHDHMIYYFLSNDILEGLQHLRLSGLTDIEKKTAANEYLTKFHEKLNKLQG
jgi:Fe-S-cluster containining protein